MSLIWLVALLRARIWFLSTILKLHLIDIYGFIFEFDVLEAFPMLADAEFLLYVLLCSIFVGALIVLDVYLEGNTSSHLVVLGQCFFLPSSRLRLR